MSSLELYACRTGSQCRKQDWSDVLAPTNNDRAAVLYDLQSMKEGLRDAKSGLHTRYDKYYCLAVVVREFLTLAMLRR